MGSARVQYELERTLPFLQLAASHGILSKDNELRSITQKRRQYENALVRRHALSSDFVQYIQYEEDLEKLRVLRVTRLKDVNKIPRADMIKMQKEAIAHIISIFERGVRRLRYDLNLWKYYIQWAHSRKMRVVQSRVSARALALFPNKVELWLLVANYELNDYQSASTARALLQKGIRLNSISHPRALSAQAAERPAKRSKKNKADAVAEQPAQVEIVSTGNQDDDTATLLLSDVEIDLVRIWTEYIRMELVFLERLRRRRIVLGISAEEVEGDAEGEKVDEEGKLNDELASDQVPISNEEEAAPTSIKSMKNGVEPNPATEALIQGAIPKSALRSAISIYSPSSLPPKTHFALLLALSQLFGTFPFCEDTTKLRDSLLSEVINAVKLRFPIDTNAILFVSAAGLFRSTAYLPLSEVESKEELVEGFALKEASILTHRHIDDLFLRQTGAEKAEDAVSVRILNVIADSLNSLQQSTDLAAQIRNLVEELRGNTLLISQPREDHFVAQLRLLRCLQGIVRERGLDEALSPYFGACFKRVAIDSKKMGCEGPHLEVERARDMLSNIRALDGSDKANSNLLEFQRHLLKVCQKYHKEEALLALYAETLLLCSQSGVLSVKDNEIHWQKLLTQKEARESVKVWTLWSEWVLNHNDERWKTEKLQSSLLQTMHIPAAHEVLLQKYLMQSTSSHDVMKRIAYIEKKTFPKPTLWIWAIDHFKEKYQTQNIDSLNVLEHLYQKLCPSNGSLEDYGSYLAFLMFDSNDRIKAMEIFREAQNRFARLPVEKVALEKIWTDLINRARQAHDMEIGER